MVQSLQHYVYGNKDLDPFLHASCQCCSGFGVSKGVTRICFHYFSDLEDKTAKSVWRKIHKKTMNLVTNVKIVGGVSSHGLKMIKGSNTKL